MAGLEWRFDLIDRASGPALRISRVFDRMDAIMRRVGATSTQTETVMGHAFARIQTVAQRMSTAVQGSFGRVTGAIRGLFNLPNLIAGGLAFYGGRFILDTLAFKETALRSLEIITGSRVQAAGLVADIVRLSEATAMPHEMVGGAVRDLALQGANRGAITNIIRGIADLAAIRGFNPATFEELSTGFLRMFTMGPQGVQMAVRAFKDTGLNMGKAEEIIARASGQTTVKVKQMMLQGLIPAKVMAVALLAAINDVVDKGKGLGATADEMRRTSLGGQLAALRQLPSHILLGLDLGGAGIGSLSRFLSNVLKATSGEAFRGRFVRLVDAALQVFDRVTPDKMLRFLDIATDAFGRFARFIPRAVSWLTEFGRGAQFAFGVIAGGYNVLRIILDPLGRLVFGVERGHSSIARLAGMIFLASYAFRFLNGVLLGLPAWLARVGVQALITGARMHVGWLLGLGPLGLVIGAIETLLALLTFLEIRFKAVSNTIGVLKGIGQTLGDLQGGRLDTDLLGNPILSVPQAPVRSTPTKPAHVSMVFHINGAQDPRAVGRQVQAHVAEALGEVFERLTMEEGYSPA